MASLLLVFLFLVSFTSSTYAGLLVSIDCGASESYTDKNSIPWIGDTSLVQTGETHVVDSSYSDYVPHQALSTLRAFSSPKQNCYSIGVGKGEQVLVRASFYYGNYDNKSDPPTFDLIFDGNFWATVETYTDQVTSHEAIYFAKGKNIKVCVAQKQANQLPFISAIEVRIFDYSDMYERDNHNSALLLTRRVAFGSDKIIRYPDDAYDRIWDPKILTDSDKYFKVPNDAPSFAVDLLDRPPSAVFLSALTTNGSLLSLRTDLPQFEVEIYINLYFTEVIKLDSTQNRSFNILISNKPYLDEPIIPSYAKADERYVENRDASSKTSFTLEATSNSTLRPLINAMEVFIVMNSMVDGTDSDDVKGLTSLQRAFSVLRNWSGDPCLPASYAWEWVVCTVGNAPRVTALHLSGFGLSGAVPDISSMNALQTLDLHNNSLSGTIPEFLGTLPSLETLNLGNNEFSGLLPSSLSNSSLNYDVSGNPNLCIPPGSCANSISRSPSVHNEKRSKLLAILATTISTSSIFWFKWIREI